MSTQQKVFEEIQSVIPKHLWDKYSHLSFAEMSEESELEEWRHELRQAENDWFDADDA
jgi:hypothetical protein